MRKMTIIEQYAQAQVKAVEVIKEAILILVTMSIFWGVFAYIVYREYLV